MKVQLIRHATLFVEVQGLRFLVDPMLSRLGTMDPSPNTLPADKNPTVDLPETIELTSVLNVDAVLLTHTHRDHWDDAAIRRLPTTLPIFCQPEDMDKITNAGFTNVTGVKDTILWNRVEITKMAARHGTGAMADKMGPVCGFFVKAENEPSLYITGDTVWCMEVEDACERGPDVVIAFAGGAEFTSGGPITMTSEDVYQLTQVIPQSHVVVVHMEAWNHCHLTREDLRKYMNDRGVGSRVLIPMDGEVMRFGTE